MNTKALNVDLLFELGCEELPATHLQQLAIDLTNTVTQLLQDAQLPHQPINTFATPRRLALLIPQLRYQQPEKQIMRLGPEISKAWTPQGSPTPACLGFARSCGVAVEDLIAKDTPKGKRLCFTATKVGEFTEDLLPTILQEAIAKCSLPKKMRWNDHAGTFLRPVRWVVLRYGDVVIPLQLFGLQSIGHTYGHRYHHPGPIHIDEVSNYASKLAQSGYVIAAIEKRQAAIVKQIDAHNSPSRRVMVDQALLDEMTCLVEWPVVLEGQFHSDYLQLPKEVLITSLHTHQKCFTVEDQHGHLLPNFILVSNIQSQSPKQVILGNERVIHARLADAAFFFHQDKEKPLATRQQQLNAMIFQAQLGTLGDKTRRLIQLSEHIADVLHEDIETAARAAGLAKCDLTTSMVYEFPSLQGVMGYYYALHDGESLACATAIKEHYLPRYAKDALPQTATGIILALSDKIDTLIGSFGIGQIPTGEKDPFALRRAALGILRLLIECKLPMDLYALLKMAASFYSIDLPAINPVSQAYTFCMHRLKAWYGERNISSHVFEAVYASHTTSPLDFHYRINAVEKFLSLPEALALSAAYKRVDNILKKSAVKLNKIDTALLTETAEQQLAQRIHAFQPVIANLCQQQQYTQALTKLADLKAPIDQFFDTVMVMTEDQVLRNNRLALLNALHQLFSTVADISLLSV